MKTTTNNLPPTTYYTNVYIRKMQKLKNKLTIAILSHD